MSTDNLSRFSEAVAADPVLAEKIRALQTEEPAVAARKFAELATVTGFAVTPEEILATAIGTEELSDEQLEKVAGGVALPGNMHELFVSQISPFGCARKP